MSQTEMVEQGHTKSKPNSFVCPSNEEVTILNYCPITECPFHVNKVQELFTIETVDTMCTFYDTTLMANTSSSRTQISALSRSKSTRISSKAIRSLYEDALQYIKSLFALTNEVATRNCSCPRCGYPNKDNIECVSTTLCKARVNWVSYILSLYKQNNSLMRRQLIWELFFHNRIHCEPNARELGISLLNEKDHGILLHSAPETIAATVNS